MHITTLEHLDRVKVGEVVRIDGAEWTRSEEGLTQGSTTLPLLAFRPMAEAKQIEFGPGIEGLPQWRGGSWLVVSEEPATGQYLALRFDGSQFYRVEMLSYDAVMGLDVQPPNYTPNADAWVMALAEVVNRAAPIGFLGDGDTLISPLLVDALHEYARDHNDLDVILAEHGVGRMRKGEVLVEARGLSRVVNTQIGREGIEVEGEPSVGWKFSYSYPAVSNMSDPCLCLTFDGDKYMAWLPENTISEEATVTCSEEDCINK